MKITSKNNYCQTVIRAKYRGKKQKKIDTMYSTTQAGYQGWLADRNKGSFEDFLGTQAKVSDKKYLIEKIVAGLKDMSISELKELLDSIYDRNFMG